MSYPVPVSNGHHFDGRGKYFKYQENSHPNFQWHPPHTRAANHTTNAYSRSQQNIENSKHYWCETCDRGFNTFDQLERHKQQHQKCNIDGCQFVAHPKVITKHIQMQHSSGLYKRMAKLDNPEEIKKWLEERKKKYPTKENIEKKSAEIKEKIERGEKMGLQQDRFQRKSAQGPGIKRKIFCHNGNNQQPTRQNFEKRPQIKKYKKEVQQNKVYTVAPLDKTNKLGPFTGIQNIDMDSDNNEDTEQLECNFVIEYDDCELLNSIDEVKPIHEPKVCGALSSLMCDYGSTDEENGDTKKVPNIINKSSQNIEVSIENNSKEFKFKTNTIEAVKETINLERESNAPKDVDENKSDDDSGPEELKVVKAPDVKIAFESASTSNTATKLVNKFKKNVTENARHSFIRPKPKVPSTLLHKLLHREVQHERNVILQCVRYIVKNNYFDKK